MRIVVSPALFHELSKKVPQSTDSLGGMIRVGNPQVEASNLFPIDTRCAICGASGEDPTDGTWCRECRGRGGSRIGGIVFDGASQTHITVALPPKFPPRFPRGLVSPRNPVRIVL